MFEEAVSDSVDIRVIESMLSSVAKTVRDVVVREIAENPREFQDILKPTVDYDPAVKALDRVVDAIHTGKELDKTEIERLLCNQEQRAELVDSLVLTHEYDRLLKFIKARAAIESVLLAAAERGRMTPSECLAFLQILTSEIKSMSSRVRSGASAIKDLASLLSKVDYAIQQNEENLIQKFSDTSPQSREIARRLGHRLTKLAKNNEKDEAKE